MVTDFIGSGYRRASSSASSPPRSPPPPSASGPSWRTIWDDWRTYLVTALSQGQERGDVRKDRSAEELAEALLTLIQGAFVSALSSRDETSLRAVSTTIPLLVEATPGPSA